MCEYVCARETAGKGSWLWQKSSMLLMHERLAIKEKGWRGMYSCSDGVACRGVNTMIQGMHDCRMHIPASGLGLYYIAGDKEDASHFD